MTLSQFHCPHCRSPFQADTSLASQQVGCPHCLQPVALISEPPVAEPPVAAPPMMDPPLAEPPLAESPPLGPRGHFPADLLPPSALVSAKEDAWPEEVVPQQAEEPHTHVDDFRARQLAADDRASRKFVKNMIVWVCCAIVLVSILAFFLMQGPS